MVERRGDARLAHEPARRRAGGVPAIDHLDGDRPLPRAIVRAVDDAHAAGAEHRVDAVRADNPADADRLIVVM